MNIKQIKEQYTCLDYLGTPVKKVANGYLYNCPWREDKNPSLSVTLDGKGWKDYATMEHGNLIDLVMKSLNTSDLSKVCAEFDKAPAKSFSFPQANSLSNEKEGGFASFELQPLRSPGLFCYLHQRKIDIDIAKRFLQEAHYSFNKREDDSYLYALAYPNDKGGVELRSAKYKGGTSPKWITTHLDLGNAPLVVFEGFLDMLSFATLCGGVKHNFITLNSVVNVDAGIEIVKEIDVRFEKIFLCLDNDEGGNKATNILLQAFPHAIDIRHRFAPSKDVNDYLIHKQKYSMKR